MAKAQRTGLGTTDTTYSGLPGVEQTDKETLLSKVTVVSEEGGGKETPDVLISGMSGENIDNRSKHEIRPKCLSLIVLV